MHVAIVAPYDPRPSVVDGALAVRGGVEEALDQLASGLARLGHEVSVVTCGLRAGVTVDRDGVRFVRVRRRGVVFRAPIAPLGRHVPASADVVHVPATYPFVSDLIPAREARRGRASVVEFQFDVYGTSRAMRLAAAAHRVSLGRLMSRATRIVIKSRDYASHSRVARRFPAERLAFVPNGVDVPAYRLGGLRRDDSLLFVGRLVPYKGVDSLLRAMPRVFEETGVDLVVAGDGPERARLEALAREVGAPVRFLGRVEREVLIDLYARARFTVLASANSQEAFGLTLLESLASGTPVVASDLPGVREIALLGGYVAPPNDSVALADTLVRALSAPPEWSPAELRARVEADYAWPRVVERMADVYEDAVAACRVGRRGLPTGGFLGSSRRVGDAP